MGQKLISGLIFDRGEITANSGLWSKNQ